MNETNYNLHITRTEGRSLKGERCSTSSKGANIHLIGCIGIKGLINPEIHSGSYNKEAVIHLIMECLRKVADQIYQEPTVIVINNSSCHLNIERRLLYPEFEGNHFLRMAPYSPMLNPIENVSSVIKSFFKRKLAENMIEILKFHQGQRKRILIE